MRCFVSRGSVAALLFWEISAGWLLFCRQGRDSSEKRVEFSFLEKRGGDDDDGDDDIESRLHRRDTPHHLKNKRIDSSSSAKDVSEEKVQHILANQAGPNCESFESWASDLPEPVEVRRKTSSSIFFSLLSLFLSEAKTWPFRY